MVKKGDIVYIPQNTRVRIVQSLNTDKLIIPDRTPEPLRGILVETNEGLSKVFLAGTLVTIKTVDIKQWREKKNGKNDTREGCFYPKFYPGGTLG